MADAQDKTQATQSSFWPESDDDDFQACTIDMLSSMNGSGNKNSTLSSSIKKQTAWISSSFDSFGDFGQDQSVASSRTPARNSRKRPRELNSQSQRSFPGKLQPVSNTLSLEEDELWSTRHAPRSQSDLAVHKKKVAEVQMWLQEHVYRKHRLAPLLLLTGPPGCGKTATVQVLTREMAVEVQEWTNPATSTYSVAEWTYEARELAVIGGPVSESQSRQFQDFLLRANKYPTLQIFHQEQLHKKIILVEEMPNVFFKDTKQFHDILRSYQRRGRCPLVFIVSDSAGGESNERLLFPKDVQAELNIANISFNPVAQTSMVKTLTLIASQEVSKGGGRFSIPDRSVIEALATSSSGDIRGAINALHFACLKVRRDVDPFQLATLSHRGTGKIQRGRGRRKKDASTNIKKSSSHHGQPAESAVGSKDTSLFLFRALGKILYCKRGSATDPPEQTLLPSHLTHLYRDPLLVNPEEVIERSQLSGEFFTAFLHQNYPEFYSSIDDLVLASEYLSDADYLTTDWVNRSTLTQYGACVASRGIMFCNSARALSSGKGPSGLGWRPLHKPQWFTAIKQARNRSAAAKCLFRGHCWSHEDLLTQTLPYLCLINVPLHSPGQISFLQEIGKYSKSKFIARSNPEKLDEKDVALEDETEDNTTVVSHQNIATSHPATDVDVDLGPSNSQGQMKDSAPVEEEIEDDEVIIEDFDD